MWQYSQLLKRFLANKGVNLQLELRIPQIKTFNVVNWNVAQGHFRKHCHETNKYF